MSNTKIDNVNNEPSVPVTLRLPRWMVDKLNKLPKRAKSGFVRYAISEKIDDAIRANKEVDEI